jgi:HrpA-like RNA helicase
LWYVCNASVSCDSFYHSCLQRAPPAELGLSAFKYRITALGTHLANLPVDVRLGKMLVYSSLFDCVHPILTIAAALGGKSPFQSPLDKREAASTAHTSYCSRAMLEYNHILSVPYPTAPSSTTLFPFSDHIAIIRAFDIWHHTLSTQGGKAAYAYCREHYLSSTGMEEIRGLRQQLLSYMEDGNLVLSSSARREREKSLLEDQADDEGMLSLIAQYICAHDDKKLNYMMIVALVCDSGEMANSLAATIKQSSEVTVRNTICAGLFPLVARVCLVEKLSTSSSGRTSSTSTVQKIIEQDDRELTLHPSSLVFR